MTTPCVVSLSALCGWLASGRLGLLVYSKILVCFKPWTKSPADPSAPHRVPRDARFGPSDGAFPARWGGGSVFMKSVAVSAERSVHGRRRRQCWLKTSGLDLVLAAQQRRLGGHGGAQQLHLGLGLLLEVLELLVRGLVRCLHDGPRPLRPWPPPPSEGTFPPH